MAELLPVVSLLVRDGAVRSAGVAHQAGYRLASFTAAAWGLAELALRLRLMLRSGIGERLRTWSAQAGERLREWTFFVVVPVMAVSVIAALWLVRFRWAATGGGPAVAVVGELVAVAGIGLRVWAIVTLDRFFTFIVGIAADHRVVQRGPYRMLRHPGYSGALLTLLGIGIVLGNWLSLLVIFLPSALALGVRIQVEERTLAHALGSEYRDYADRTARLIPGIW